MPACARPAGSNPSASTGAAVARRGGAPDAVVGRRPPPRLHSLARLSCIAEELLMPWWAAFLLLVLGGCDHDRLGALPARRAPRGDGGAAERARSVHAPSSARGGGGPQRGAEGPGGDGGHRAPGARPVLRTDDGPNGAGGRQCAA